MQPCMLWQPLVVAAFNVRGHSWPPGFPCSFERCIKNSWFSHTHFAFLPRGVFDLHRRLGVWNLDGTIRGNSSLQKAPLNLCWASFSDKSDWKNANITSIWVMFQLSTQFKWYQRIASDIIGYQFYELDFYHLHSQFVTRVTQAILDCSDSTQQLCMQAHALVTAARVAPRAPHLGGEAQFDNSVSIVKLRAVSIL